jgi:isopentenyl-diphosphate delta-isomerase
MTEEVVVYVDAQGQPTGETAAKATAHNAHTKMHLGFSCYVFNKQGQLLVTQRALNKQVWPGVWTNTVCGHPAPAEQLEGAITRRATHELGLTVTDIQIVLPHYTYKTPPFDGIIEHEFCPVYLARTTAEPKPNPQEVEDTAWIAWPEFVAAAQADHSDFWSWWCKDQLKQLLNHPLIAEYIVPR